MIVVISDIHLNDGTVCTGTDAGAAELFWENLRDQVDRAGHRSDGSIKPVDTVDLILLGDIFDFIRSNRWLAECARPWDPINAIVPTVSAICEDIIATNSEFLAVFKENAQKPIKVTGGEVTVNVHYMVGNHDWMLWASVPAMHDVRKRIVEVMGLSKTVGRQFCWTIGENQYLETQCLKHRTYVQHGDMHDSVNYHAWQGRGAASLGDAIVIELVTAWPRKALELVAQRSPNHSLSAQTVERIKEIDNVRPSSQAAVYARRVIESLTDPIHRAALSDALKECTSAITKTEIYRRVLKNNPTVALQIAALNWLQPFVPTPVMSAITWVADLFDTGYATAASKEKWVDTNWCDFVVYGHTHVAEVTGIGAPMLGKQKIYINSATWRPSHTEIKMGKLESFPYFHQKNMTWVAIYQGNERKGKTHEIWDGSLGLK